MDGWHRAVEAIPKMRQGKKGVETAQSRGYVCVNSSKCHQQMCCREKWQELRLNSVPKGIFSGSLDEQCDQKNHAVPGHMQWNGDANVISCVCCLLCDSRSVLWITLPCCSCLPAPASTCLLTQTFLHKNTPEGRTTHKHTSDVSEQF